MSIKHRQGFTLIELLVVVAIIVVLLALLTPAMDKALDHAERMRCMTNLRGIGLALQTYMVSNRGSLMPPKGGPNGETTTEAGVPFDNWWWYPHWLDDYGASRAIYQCPNDVGWPAGNFPNPLHTYPQYDHNSYYLSIGVAGIDWAENLANRKVMKFAEAHKHAMVMDWPAITGHSWHDADPTNPDRQFDGAKNHIAFVDGHVSNTEIFWSGGWSFQYQPPLGYDYYWLAPQYRTR